MDRNSIYKSIKFIDSPYDNHMLRESMKDPSARISEINGRVFKILSGKNGGKHSWISRIFQKIIHTLKLLFLKDYKTKFNKAVKKIDLYKNEKEQVKEKAITKMQSIIRMQTTRKKFLGLKATNTLLSKARKELAEAKSDSLKAQNAFNEKKKELETIGEAILLLEEKTNKTIEHGKIKYSTLKALMSEKHKKLKKKKETLNKELKNLKVKIKKNPFAKGSTSEKVKEIEPAVKGELASLAKKMDALKAKIRTLETTVVEHEKKAKALKEELVGKATPSTARKSVKVKKILTAQPTAKDNMLKTIEEKVHPDMKKAWEAIFSYFEADMVESWTEVRKDKFVLKLKQPLDLWVPSDDTELKKGSGVILHMKKELEVTFEGKKMSFEGFENHVLLAKKIFLVGDYPVPNIYSIEYLDKGAFNFSAGKMGIKKGKEQLASDVINNWTNNGEVVTAEDHKTFLKQKAANA